MLTADAIFLATKGERKICVVSSDDDLLPAIRTALILGADVLHMHTKIGRRTASHYTKTIAKGYVELTLG
jgi:hypothetical protein